MYASISSTVAKRALRMPPKKITWIRLAERVSELLWDLNIGMGVLEPIDEGSSSGLPEG